MIKLVNNSVNKNDLIKFAFSHFQISEGKNSLEIPLATSSNCENA